MDAASEFACFPLPPTCSADANDCRYSALIELAKKPETTIKSGGHTPEALAIFFQILACGEESAVHVFYRAGSIDGISAGANALASIAAEEEQHERILRSLRFQLREFSDPDTAKVRRRQAREFFLSLQTRDFDRHLSRVAALDSCVTKLLNLMCRGPILSTSAAAGVSAILQRIRSDEAGHVRTTRDIVLQSPGGAAVLAEEHESISKHFSAFLKKEAWVFERLGVDFDVIEKKISHPIN
jgi:rubrerythrin